MGTSSSFALMGVPALGAPLNIVLDPAPDLTAGIIDTSYTANNLMMIADCFSLAYDNGGGQIGVFDGGNFVSGTLVAANLAAFGFDGDWSTDWSDDGVVPTGIANTGVPAPGTVALAGLAGLTRTGGRRRSRRRQTPRATPRSRHPSRPRRAGAVNIRKFHGGTRQRG